jgi:hypothetical protein
MTRQQSNQHKNAPGSDSANFWLLLVPDGHNRIYSGRPMGWDRAGYDGYHVSTGIKRMHLKPVLVVQKRCHGEDAVRTLE